MKVLIKYKICPNCRGKLYNNLNGEGRNCFPCNMNWEIVTNRLRYDTHEEVIEVQSIWRKM